jgi:hypothetical protein
MKVPTEPVKGSGKGLKVSTEPVKGFDKGLNVSTGAVKGLSMPDDKIFFFVISIKYSFIYLFD